jgi:hypothetical protein
MHRAGNGKRAGSLLRQMRADWFVAEVTSKHTETWGKNAQKREGAFWKALSKTVVLAYKTT